MVRSRFWLESYSILFALLLRPCELFSWPKDSRKACRFSFLFKMRKSSYPRDAAWRWSENDPYTCNKRAGALQPISSILTETILRFMRLGSPPRQRIGLRRARKRRDPTAKRSSRAGVDAD